MGQLIEYANNHPVLFAGTWLMALVVIFYEIRLRSRSLYEVSTAQAVQLINRGGRVVDIREPDRFAAGHVVDAIRVPADRLASGDDKRLKKNRPVIVVCDNGAASGRCVEPLRKAGYEQSYSLRGGIAAWQRDNLPVVSGKQKEQAR